MDSFYIILPSNTPFPGNRTSDYIVKLPNIIDLSDGNWTVALSSIIYPLSFIGSEDDEKILINYKNGKSTTIKIPRRIQYESEKEFEIILNNIIYDNLSGNIGDKQNFSPKNKRSSTADTRPTAQLRNKSTDKINNEKDTRPIAQLREKQPEINLPQKTTENKNKPTLPQTQIEQTKSLEITNSRPAAQLKEVSNTVNKDKKDNKQEKSKSSKQQENPPQSQNQTKQDKSEKQSQTISRRERTHTIYNQNKYTNNRQ